MKINMQVELFHTACSFIFDLRHQAWKVLLELYPQAERGFQFQFQSSAWARSFAKLLIWCQDSISFACTLVDYSRGNGRDTFHKDSLKALNQKMCCSGWPTSRNLQLLSKKLRNTSCMFLMHWYWTVTRYYGRWKCKYGNKYQIRMGGFFSAILIFKYSHYLTNKYLSTRKI